MKLPRILITAMKSGAGKIHADPRNIESNEDAGDKSASFKCRAGLH